MQRSDAPLVRMMRGAVYGVVVTMPLSALYPLSEPLGPGRVELYVTPGLEPSDVPVAILLLLAGIDRWLSWRRGVEPPHRRSVLLTIVLLIGALGVASIIGALTPALAAFTALRWLLAAAVLWAIVRSRIAPQRLAYVLGLSLCVHVVVALLQVWYAGPLGLPGELTLRPDQLSAPVVNLGETLWLRGYGLTFHPNVLGGYLAVALILLLPLLNGRLARIISYLLVVGLLSTLSRSAILGLLLAAPPFVWWLLRADSGTRAALRRAATVFTCVVVVSVVVLWRPISVRLDPLLVQFGLGQGDPRAADGLIGRKEMNALAVDIILRHPFLGIGAGNFPVAMRDARTSQAPQYVHNVALLLGAEVGVAGSLAWLAIAAAVGAVLVRRLHDTWTAAAAAASLVLLVVSLFDCYPWSLNAGRLLTVTVLALLERR